MNRSRLAFLCFALVILDLVGCSKVDTNAPTKSDIGKTNEKASTDNASLNQQSSPKENTTNVIEVRQTNSASTSISIFPKESISINQSQKQFNEKVYKLEETMKNADTSTREGDSQFRAANDELKKLREATVNSRIENWNCIAFRPLGPKDISKDFSSFERDGKKVSDLICSADQSIKFSTVISQATGEEITLSIYEDDAKKIGKVFNNDRITFTGVIQGFSSRGPGRYYLRANVESIKLTEAK